MKKKLGFALALTLMFQFTNLNAAPIDKELAVLASEQAQEQKPESETKVDKPVPKTKQELEAEEKRLREEKRAEEKRLKEEKEAARKKIEEGKRETIMIDTDRNNRSRRMSQADNETSIIRTAANDTSVVQPVENNVPEVAPPAEKISDNTPKESPEKSSEPVGMPNPIKLYASFEELADALGFTPLYIPKKSGYTINEIMSISNKIAEIRYGRRWEPEVLLAIRTYKRAPDEELDDISGIQGVKWRVDESSGSTVYIAKISDSNHAAAWAVGNFTFSAYVENLSFAAFYALVVEELVDLSNHYYVA